MAKYPKDKKGRYYIDRKIAGKRCMLRADTISELDKKLTAWMKSTASEEEEKASGPYFEKVAKEWYTDVEKSRAYATATGYKYRLNSAIDYFKGERIEDITAKDIKQFYEKMAKQSYAKKTIKNQKIVIDGIFKYYCIEYDSMHNPAELVDVTVGKVSVERTPPPDEAINAVKSHPDGFGIVALILMYTGLRISELNGLLVDDIDLNNGIYGCKGTIHVKQEAKWMIGGKPYIKPPKTDAGIRDVPILDALYTPLKAYMRGLGKGVYLISGTEEPLTEKQYEYRWDAYCKSIGFAEDKPFIKKSRGKEYVCHKWKATITAHQFRHYLATLCFDGNVPTLVAKKIIGHADETTTKKVYTHIRDKKLEEGYSIINSIS